MGEIELQATPSGLSILQAWSFVKEHGKSNKKRWKNAPLAGLNANWSKVVIDKDSGTVNHRAYTFWMLEQVLEALHRHDLYIVGSEKYGDLRSLDWSIDSYESLTPLKEELDKIYHQVIENYFDTFRQTTRT